MENVFSKEWLLLNNKKMKHISARITEYLQNEGFVAHYDDKFIRFTQLYTASPIIGVLEFRLEDATFTKASLIFDINSISKSLSARSKKPATMDVFFHEGYLEFSKTMVGLVKEFKDEVDFKLDSAFMTSINTVAKINIEEIAASFIDVLKAVKKEQDNNNQTIQADIDKKGFDA